MTMDGIPEFVSPQRAIEAYQTHAAGEGAAARLREAAKAGTLLTEKAPSGLRTFLSPTHPMTKFLIKSDTVNYAPFHPGGAMGIRPVMGREGDVWVRFNNGVCTVDEQAEPDKLAWLLAHSGDPQAHQDYHVSGGGVKLEHCKAPIGLCREQGPGIDVWAEFKIKQVPTASRPAVVSPEIDIDAFMRMNPAAHQASTLRTGEGARMAAIADNNEQASRDRQYGQRG